MQKREKYNPRSLKELYNNQWNVAVFINSFLSFIEKNYPHILKEFKESQKAWEKKVSNDLKKMVKQTKETISKRRR